MKNIEASCRLVCLKNKPNPISVMAYNICKMPSGNICKASIYYRIAGNTRGVQISFFSFSVYISERKFNTRNICCDGRVFLCKMDRTKLNTRISAQNEIWNPQKFPTIRYSGHPWDWYFWPLHVDMWIIDIMERWLLNLVSRPHKISGLPYSKAGGKS